MDAIDKLIVNSLLGMLIPRLEEKVKGSSKAILMYCDMVLNNLSADDYIKALIKRQRQFDFPIITDNECEIIKKIENLINLCNEEIDSNVETEFKNDSDNFLNNLLKDL